MKTVPIALVSLLLGTTACHLSSHRSADARAGALGADVDSARTGKQTVLRTGSLIPRTVDKNGWITDGPSPVAVMDQETLQKMGARDVADALRRGGWNH